MVAYIVKYVDTGKTVEWGDILISKSGNRYTFIEAVAPNRVRVWDGENKVYRTFYASSVFGRRTLEVKNV